MADTQTDADRLRECLVKIAEAYEMRAELFVDDADCAACFAEWANAALSGRRAADG